MSLPPLISSQRHLDPAKVADTATRFHVFIVNTDVIELRGREYRILIDGHHNLAAARSIGREPTWRGPTVKWARERDRTLPAVFERFLINNLTDSDWYYVDTGEVVPELLKVHRGISQ